MRYLFLTTASAMMLAACAGENADEATDEAALNEAIESAASAEPEQASEATDAAAEQEAARAKVASENLAAATAFLAENAKNEGVTVTQTGLQYEVLTAGADDGAAPLSTDQVVVHYIGTLKDGTEFDSSVARGEPARFSLNQVIPDGQKAFS